MIKGNQVLVSYKITNSQSNPRRAIFEKRELDNRRRQDTRQDIIKELQQDSLLMNTIASDLRVDKKRRMKQAGLQELEKETLRSHLEDLQRAKETQEDLLREETLVKEMNSLYQEQLREQKMRQAIKEGSAELRELEQKLNNAYINKERLLQQQEKKLLSEQIVAEENYLYGDWKAQAAKMDQEELETQAKNQEKVEQYQESLHKQMEEQKQKKKEDYDLFLKEKAMVDEIVKNIMLENEKEAKLMLQKRQETKGYVEQFTKDRRIWMELEKTRQDEENRKIEHFARLQKEREQGLIAKKKLLAAGKDLAADMQNKEKLKIELEDLRIDLAQEEQEAQARKNDTESMQRRIRKRLETIDAYHAQIADKRARAQENEKEEAEFREMLMNKFAEDDRIEQMKQTSRRMKQLEHRRAVDAIVEDRRKINAEKDKEAEKEQEREEEVARYKAEVIEQERQRLLLEHASKLAGFLPKDLELFDDDFRRRFERTTI